MRLRPGLRVLTRTDGEVQVGTDPRWAVRLDGLTERETAALLALGAGADSDQLAADTGARLGELAALLRDAGLAAPDRRSPAVLGPAAADATVWGLLRPDGDGARVVDARRAAVVGVVGLGPIGLATAGTLAAAGVGTVLVDDASPVRSVDVGVCGYRWSDVGSVRERAAARVLRDIAPDVRTDSAAEPDVVAVVEHGAADPARTELLLGTGTVHLPVLVREADAVVGPLVVPGIGPCLRCLDLHRADADPCWPRIVAQLVGAPPAAEVGAMAAVCAGLAAAAVLRAVDDPPARTRLRTGTTFEVGLPDVLPRTRTWEVHPDCGCTSHGAAAVAG